jgi:hypothetical protein
MAHPLTTRLLAIATVFVLLASTAPIRADQGSLPASIPDAEFWSLTERLSEPNGTFRSDNLLSNEMTLSSVATMLAERVKPNGVYLGVGPEQNFTYIAAIRPRIAFITDIRRGNLHLQLMYKALFELSADRAEFVSRLLTKPRPAGLTAQSTAADLMNAYWDIPTSAHDVYKSNLQAIYDVLVRKHGFPLSPEDFSGIEYVYHAFYWFGPAINYSSSTSGAFGGRTTYADLMMTRDTNGAERGYLSTEEGFLFLKAMQSKNLIVPVVGNFAGPKALRAIGDYLRERKAVVSAFYVSNVESYLRGSPWTDFCGNVATMPLDDSSVFIRPLGGNVTFMIRTVSGTQTIAGGTPIPTGAPGSVAYRPGTGSPFASIAEEVKNCK